MPSNVLVVLSNDCSLGLPLLLILHNATGVVTEKVGDETGMMMSTHSENVLYASRREGLVS